MLFLEDIKIELKSQGFEAKQISFSPTNDSAVVCFKSTRKTKDVICPECGGKVYIHDSFDITLKDIPLYPGMPLSLFCMGHRYRCCECNKSSTEKIPFAYPETRITKRAANWIKSFLKNKMSIRAIQDITGIHWDTIRKVQQEIMDEALMNRETELQKIGYSPKYLAVDEFAIHKGHIYATTVMDIETGDILWVSKGRSMNDFEKFFQQTDSSLLSTVMAVAMDMNASYNRLVEKYLPYATIVYDRYHMQAQFGKEVLGVVRLEEARKHKHISEEILAGIHEDTDKETRRELKIQAKTEKQNYSKLKKAQGFNNKIKVAKRIGYGYRNEGYFFKLIRYLSLPSVRNSSPNFP